MMIATEPNPLTKLSDKELIHRLETLTQKERQTTLEVLLHLIEVDRRSLYLPRGYASLFDYCTRRLRYSESAAMRRIKSARCIADFPEVYDLLAKGRLNLVAVSLIAGILTKENKSQLLAEAVDKSTREIETLVALYNPKKIIRDRVRPVYVAKLVEKEQIAIPSGKEFTAGAGGKNPCNVDNSTPGRRQIGTASKRDEVELEKRFKLEFTVDPQFMEKINEVRAILSTKYPRGIKFEKLFEIIIDEFIDRHSPQKKVKRRERRMSKRREKESDFLTCASERPALLTLTRDGYPRLSAFGGRSSVAPRNGSSTRFLSAPRVKKSRLVPAAVRDAVFSRDRGLCAFVSNTGVRCNSRWNLQIDHIIPRARGGGNTISNLRLLCGKHNRLEAERAYGREFMAQYYKRE